MSFNEWNERIISLAKPKYVYPYNNTQRWKEQIIFPFVS